MSSHAETEAKPDSHSKPTAHTEEAAPAAPSKADRMRLLLKVVARFGLMGLPPALALAALAVAVIALNSNKANVAQLSKIEAEIASLNTSLSATKAEVDKLKFAAAKEKNLQSEWHAKSEERISTIVQNMTPMQIKMKIRPTLEEQLSQPASAAIAATPAHAAPATPPAPHVAPAPTHAAPTPRVAEKPAAKPAPVKVIPKPEAKHEAAPHAKEPAKKTSPTPATSSNEKTVHPQVKVMKEAIEQFNGKR
ncbi:MAG: hypothetical protein Q8O24_05250 [Gallionellaceae bacterium]|nr:hypothetical protein [Gallionellaceae bacterium]